MMPGIENPGNLQRTNSSRGQKANGTVGNSTTVRFLELVSLNITFFIFIGFVHSQHGYNEVTHKSYMLMWITYSATNMLVIVDLLSRLMCRKIDLIPWLMFCGMSTTMYVLTATFFGIMASKISNDSFVVLTAFGCSISALAFLMDFFTGIWKYKALEKKLDTPGLTELSRVKSKTSRTTKGSKPSRASIANSYGTRSSIFIQNGRNKNGTCPRHESLAKMSLHKSHPEGNFCKLVDAGDNDISYGEDPPPLKKPRIPSGCCITSWSEMEATMDIQSMQDEVQDQGHKDLEFVREHWRRPQAQWAQCIEIQPPAKIGYLVPLKKPPAQLLSVPQRIANSTCKTTTPPSTPGSLGPAPPKKPKWSSKFLGISV